MQVYFWNQNLANITQINTVTVLIMNIVVTFKKLFLPRNCECDLMFLKKDLYKWNSVKDLDMKSPLIIWVTPKSL